MEEYQTWYLKHRPQYKISTIKRNLYKKDAGVP
jgi:hypothetical protein